MLIKFAGYCFLISGFHIVERSLIQTLNVWTILKDWQANGSWKTFFFFFYRLLCVGWCFFVYKSVSYCTCIWAAHYCKPMYFQGYQLAGGRTFCNRKFAALCLSCLKVKQKYLIFTENFFFEHLSCHGSSRNKSFVKIDKYT